MMLLVISILKSQCLLDEQKEYPEAQMRTWMVDVIIPADDGAAMEFHHIGGEPISQGRGVLAREN